MTLKEALEIVDGRNAPREDDWSLLEAAQVVAKEVRIALSYMLESAGSLDEFDDNAREHPVGCVVRLADDATMRYVEAEKKLREAVK